MPNDDQKCRQQLWRRHLVHGEDLDEVVGDFTTNFDVDEQIIHDDFATVDEWLLHSMSSRM